jgi:DNA modification methylase
MTKRRANANALPPLRLEWRSPTELAENPRNWRRHPDAQLAALEDVIKEVGWAGVCLFNERTDRLIDGHLRKQIGLKRRDEKVPVLIGNWSEEQETKILATLDPISAMAQADGAKLEELLRNVKTDSAAVQSLLDELATKVSVLNMQAGLTDPDVIPEPPDEATTRLGDLWYLGNHLLLCGDAGVAADVDRLLDGAPVHMVNTDPPYNVKVEPRSNNAIAAGLSSFEATHHERFDVNRHPEKANPTEKKLRPKDRPLANDFVSDEAFEQMLTAWFGNIPRVLQPGRAFYIWGGYANVANYPPVLKRCGLYFSQAIIWVKEHPVLTRKDFMGNHEWCFYGWREGAGHEFFGPPNVPDVWSVKKINPQSMIHLTEKPTELAARAMRYSSRPGENVLDLFGGSGSTLIAAEQTERRAFLLELDPLYCDVIIQRWEQFTGRKAERALTS